MEHTSLTRQRPPAIRSAAPPQHTRKGTHHDHHPPPPAGWFGRTPGDKTWIPETQEQAIAPLVASGQLTPEDAIPTARYGIQGRCAASLYTISPALLDQAHA